MNTIIDSLKYLLQERYNYFLFQSKQYIKSPYKRDMEIIKKLMVKLDRIKWLITYIFIPLLGFVLSFTIIIWLSKILLH